MSLCSARSSQTNVGAFVGSQIKDSSPATQSRPKITPGTLSGRPGAPRSVPGASRRRLGSISGGPRRVPGAPGGSPRASRDASRGAQERSGTCRDSQNRLRVASGSAKSEFCSLGAFAKRRRSNFSQIFAVFRCFRKVCEVPEVLRLPAKTGVRPFALRVVSLVQRNLEKHGKSTRKSTQNRRKSRLGATRAPFSVDFRRSKGLCRATRGDSQRFGPKRGGQVARLGGV